MRFKSFYLLESDYKFDLKYLNSLKSYSQKIKYAENKLKKIGEGTSRIVFDMEDGYVIKLAKNEKGLAQNLTDGDWGLQKMYPNLIPQLKDRDENDDCYWIIVKKANKITPAKFKSITEMSFNELSKAITEADFNRTGKIKWANVSDAVKKMLDDEDSLIYQVNDIIGNYDMPVGDLIRISSWGEIDGKVKIVDAGLTTTTFNTYYRK